MKTSKSTQEEQQQEEEEAGIIDGQSGEGGNGITVTEVILHQSVSQPRLLSPPPPPPPKRNPKTPYHL